MADNLFNTVYNPDVLSCLANLSNDEVFTPPEVVNLMLDMLPPELFRNPDTIFLDPACKTGVFLREIAKRLIIGLEPQMPDLQERIDHIFHNQLFGIAITELTSLLSRRGLYCSKYPNSEFSVTQFDDAEGNLRYRRIQHKWKDSKCVYCNASQSQYERGDELETHAYEWIHTLKPEEIFNMKFDVIISNPPYQLSDGGAQASASPLYHLFVKNAKKLNPKYMTMIIPARWYAGGKGLDAFREEMLDDVHLKELHDFPITDDCFPGVNIRGGVCYFLWEKDFDNSKYLTKVVTHEGKNQYVIRRRLRYENLDIFIRHGRALEILNKVEMQSNGKGLMPYVSPRKPFGLSTDFVKSDYFKLKNSGMKNPLYCYGKSKSLGFVERSIVTAHTDWIDQWKVMVSRANNIGTELNDDNLNTLVLAPGYICTESYMVIGVDLNLDKKECNNLAQYLQTRFVRFLHSMAKASQDATSKTYRFVPIQDFAKSWTDEELYEKYGLTDDEINYIETMIKPMDGGDTNAD